jgi:hypothetical protein
MAGWNAQHRMVWNSSSMSFVLDAAGTWWPLTCTTAWSPSSWHSSFPHQPQFLTHAINSSWGSYKNSYHLIKPCSIFKIAWILHLQDYNLNKHPIYSILLWPWLGWFSVGWQGLCILHTECCLSCFGGNYCVDVACGGAQGGGQEPQTCIIRSAGGTGDLPQGWCNRGEDMCHSWDGPSKLTGGDSPVIVQLS